MAWFENLGAGEFATSVDHHGHGIGRCVDPRSRRRLETATADVLVASGRAISGSLGTRTSAAERSAARQIVTASVSRPQAVYCGGPRRGRRPRRALREHVGPQDRLVREPRRRRVPAPAGDHDLRDCWAKDVYAADLDGDGDLDVLATASERRSQDRCGTRTSAEASFGAQRGTHDLGGARQSPCSRRTSTETATPDVLSASFWDNKLAWYENLGAGGVRRAAA